MFIAVTFGLPSPKETSCFLIGLVQEPDDESLAHGSLWQESWVRTPAVVVYAESLGVLSQPQAWLAMYSARLFKQTRRLPLLL